MPGDQVARLKRQAREAGIGYPEEVWRSLAEHATRLGVALPEASPPAR